MFFTIFKKELLDTLRDRRTLIRFVVLPVALFPLLFWLMSRLVNDKMEEEFTQQYKIGIIDHGQAPKLRQLLDLDLMFTMIDGVAEEDFEALIDSDSLHAALIIHNDFDTLVQHRETAYMEIYYKSTKNARVFSALSEKIKGYESLLLAANLEQLDIPESAINPIEIDEYDYIPIWEKGPFKALDDMMGRLLPFIFVLFCFAGAMYCAIDLFTGEKERGTLETILTTPASRSQIVMGKIAVVSLVGACSAILAALGVLLGLEISGEGMVDGLFESMQEALSFSAVLSLTIILLPLSLFLASLLSMFSIYARTFKEALSTIMPLYFVVLVPCMIGMMDLAELSLGTALIPILNVILASEALIAGKLSMPMFLTVTLSLLGFALLSLLLAVRWFDNEKNLLR